VWVNGSKTVCTLAQIEAQNLELAGRWAMQFQALAAIVVVAITAVAGKLTLFLQRRTRAGVC
jgi:hypothetical protein